MKVEFNLAYDSQGCYGVGDEESDAVADYLERNELDTALHVVKLSLDIQAPEPITLSGVVPYSVTSEIVKLVVEGK